jgi:hypothetical protein
MPVRIGDTAIEHFPAPAPQGRTPPYPMPSPAELGAVGGSIIEMPKGGFIVYNSKGDPETQKNNDDIAKALVKALKKRGIPATHVGGGTGKTETYYPGPNKGTTKGSGRTDSTVKIEDTEEILDQNTVDTWKDRETPTARERRNRDKIEELRRQHLPSDGPGRFDTFPKSRGMDMKEWARRNQQKIEEIADSIAESRKRGR